MTVEISTTEDTTTRESMFPVISASTLGTAIEWFDFFLYGFLAVTVFPTVFFPQLDPFAGIIASFTTNFVGFAARPLGGAFFGWFGDRIGRQSTLVATLLLIGTTTIMMGTLPGYVTIGIAAPILLFVLRFLQGLGVGGEWGGAVLLAMEYGDDRHRGFWTSWPQTGVPLGLALSALSVLLFRSLYPSVAFQSIGWRIPFLLSAMLVIVGLYIRLRILETPRFARVKAEKRESQAPLIDAFRYHWREVVLSALARSGEQAPFYIFTTFVLSYAVETLKLETLLLYTGFIVAALIAILTIPAFSALSDRIGRRRWSLIGAVMVGAFAFPYFLLLNTRNPLLVVIAIALSLGLCHAWLYGPQAALIAERFSTKLRYTGTSLGYQLASIIAGGPAPIIATYLLANREALAPGYPGFVLIAAYIIIMAGISLIAILLLKEYAGGAPAEDVN
ncbi:MAG TPA: MFS transporter [Ktedonobacteraceae bacterium]|jgi:MFS family permease|nr:MFS transporter [Ktedonobacteraceae bacterium]